jgi:hypothetical protein
VIARVRDGKEGVDGSSPSEGFEKALQMGLLVVCTDAASAPRGYETGTFSDARPLAGTSGLTRPPSRLALFSSQRQKLPASRWHTLPMLALGLSTSFARRYSQEARRAESSGKVPGQPAIDCFVLRVQRVRDVREQILGTRSGGADGSSCGNSGDARRRAHPERVDEHEQLVNELAGARVSGRALDHVSSAAVRVDPTSTELHGSTSGECLRPDADVDRVGQDSRPVPSGALAEHSVEDLAESRLLLLR